MKETDGINTNREPTVVGRSLAMLALIVAGESIFFLPFVLARVFRPTLLEVFHLTNLQLGAAFSIYGVVAMLAYFPGGPLADRFPPKRMMAIALVATSSGGLVLAANPSLVMLQWLYGFWGLTTILLFWSPLMRATRAWGGQSMQGRAFGFLDGGRGLVAAVVGSIAVGVFAMLSPADPETLTEEQRAAAFRHVILIFTGTTFFTAVLVLLAPSVESRPAVETAKTDHPKNRLKRVFTLPTVWLQAGIVFCAYAGYKGLDDISLYAKDALQFDEVDAAKIGAVTLWVRPIAAIAAGFAADRWNPTRMTVIAFVILGLGSGAIGAGMLAPGMLTAFFVTLFATSAALFALRGLYFAIMEEGHIPASVTGTAVGLVSVVGYLPDIFMGPLMGVLIDRSPGALGHERVFAVVSLFAWLGVAATVAFAYVAKRQNSVEPAVT